MAKNGWDLLYETLKSGASHIWLDELSSDWMFLACW